MNVQVENIRIYIRNRLGFRSWPYRLGSAATTFLMAFFRGGVQGVKVALMANETGAGKWVVVRGLVHPIFIRPGTEDVSSVLNNIFREEYGQVSNDLAPRLIIDAGAYIGDTSAYFMSRFRAAQVIALEPNTESFQLASENLRPYGARVELLNVALCRDEGTVKIAGHSTGAGVSESGFEVQAVSMQSLMRERGLDSVDILKMDIEGSELEVLKNSSDWLPKIKLLLLETHGTEIESAVLPVLARAGFLIRRVRNVWYCSNTASRA